MTSDGAQAGASAAFRTYLEEIGRNLTAGNATEHTHRPALQNLVQTLDPGVRAVNEPKRVACGAPDCIVTRNDLPVGYIEAKDVGRSLDEIERDEQLKRYRESLSNLILTDYLEFRWYKDGEKQQAARIAYMGDSGQLRPDREGQKQAAAMFSSFLAQEPPIVGKPEDLARRMAALTRIVRDIVRSALEHDRSGGSPLREQLEGFRRVLIHDLGEEQFADMYAQTIAYGLFAARVNAPADEHFSRQHAAYDLPKTNPFLRQMFGQIAGPELDERIAWAVDDLAELLARARMDLVLEDFGKRTRQEDPVVHFYETFLKAYDPKMRETRGVYFTPEPVVSYIVRSVDHILKTEFGLPDGLADNSMIEVPVPGKPKETRMVHKVQILDPACGTGTFLAEVMETIRETVVAKHGAGMWPGYVHDHLLPRLYGFELLMAPYAIAHLKLGLRLKETGYDIEQSERLRVYLTNSLEEAREREHGQLTFFGNWLAEEADRASEVKRELPIMVVLGNPPYSGISANMSPDIAALVDAYRTVDGESLGERKVWLQDDYVKFMRFAQLRIERTGMGVVALISNHGYLDNLSHRGLRRSLLDTFEDILIVDLHGNVKKRETCPDGSKDENVFDIQQGVAIGIFVRGREGGKGACRVRRADLYGGRGAKYEWLSANATMTTQWRALEPAAKTYSFAVTDRARAEEFDGLIPITDAFGLRSNGIQTSRDHVVYGFADSELRETIELFHASEEGNSNSVLRTRFWPGKRVKDYAPGDTRGWSLVAAREALRDDERWQTKVVSATYRPMDFRSLFFADYMIDWPRSDVMRNMIMPNLALCVGRAGQSIGSAGWSLVFVSNRVTDMNLFYRGGNVNFPLYVYETAEGLPDLAGAPVVRRSNLGASITSAIRDRLGLETVVDQPSDWQNVVSARDIVHYMYGTLSSPAYRSRFAEFLRVDFPRIPVTSDRELFRELSRLGGRLVSLHLMDVDAATQSIYPIAGDNRVERVRYTEPGQGSEQGRVWINTTQCFDGVPPEVWDFRVGGYQICEKWLKDRKGRHLTYDDLTEYRRVVAALAETISLMREIDEVIESHGGWPLG